MTAVCHGDEVMHAFELRRQRGNQRREADIEEEKLVLGVVDDVRDLLLEQPRVHRVQHRTHAGHAKEQLQVTVAVSGHRAHASAFADSKRP